MTLDGEQQAQLDKIRELLKIFFKDEPEKVEYWINTPNLNLGGATVIRLIQLGRGHKVLNFIESAREENGW